MTTHSRIQIFNRGNRRGEVLIYDVIGGDFFGDGVTAKNFRSDLEALGDIDVLDVRINSPGGSIFDGIPIYNTLRDHKATVNVHIDGAAWSMASGIAMAGDVVNMAENALMMLHDPTTFSFGNAEDLRKEATRLEKVKDQLTIAYERKSGQSRDEIANIMSAETWLDANEAKDMGFVDNVTASVEIENMFDTPDFIRIPGNRFSAAMNLLRPKPSPKKEVIDMADTIQPSDSNVNATAVDNVIANQSTDETPATIEQLSALEGADSDFILEHAKNKSTISQATNALNKALSEELAKLRSPEAADQTDDENRAQKPAVGTKDPLGTDTPAPVDLGKSGSEYGSMNAKQKQVELRRLVEEQRAQLGNRFDHLQVLNRLSVTHSELFSETHLQPVS